MSELPAGALEVVSRIEALLDEGRRLTEGPGGLGVDDATYALKETERRYLPDTLSAYLDIPPSQRDAAAAEMLVGQLTLLEKATGQRLAALAATSRTTQAANGAFLSDRFGPAESLPNAPDVKPAEGPSRTLVARFFSQLDDAAATDPQALITVAAEKFSKLFPRLTTVKRGLFGGPPRAIMLDVPRGDHVLRYALGAARSGIEASVTKVVRGVALRTEICDIGEWLRGLFEDVSAYVERDRSTRELLTSFFAR